MAGEPTPLQLEDLIRRYNAGESARQLAAAFDISRPTVMSRLGAAGVTLRQRPQDGRAELTPTQVAELADRYQAGESVDDLAASFGVGRKAVYNRLDAAGVPRQRRRAKDWAAEAAGLYRTGQLTQAEIGARYGLPQTRVSQVLASVDARIGRGEAMRRRLARMTAAERSELAAAAHDAVRGRNLTQQHMERRAVGKQRTQSGATDDERDIMDALAEAGEYAVCQQAVGKYNLDLGVAPVAVELFGGAWHAYGRHRARLRQRTVDLADAGWNLLIAWTSTGRSGVHPLVPSAVAQDVVAYLQRTRSDPTFRRQYRVIWGDGQFLAAGCVDDDELTLVPTGIRGAYARRR